MFVVINIEVHVKKWNYGYKTAEIHELSYKSKVKVNRYNKQCLQSLS